MTTCRSRCLSTRKPARIAFISPQAAGLSSLWFIVGGLTVREAEPRGKWDFLIHGALCTPRDVAAVKNFDGRPSRYTERDYDMGLEADCKQDGIVPPWERCFRSRERTCRSE